jgi:hypothetical protein
MPGPVLLPTRLTQMGCEERHGRRACSTACEHTRGRFTLKASALLVAHVSPSLLPTLTLFAEVVRRQSDFGPFFVSYKEPAIHVGNHIFSIIATYVGGRNTVFCTIVSEVQIHLDGHRDKVPAGGAWDERSCAVPRRSRLLREAHRAVGAAGNPFPGQRELCLCVCGGGGSADERHVSESGVLCVRCTPAWASSQGPKSCARTRCGARWRGWSSMKATHASITTGMYD